MDESVLTAQEDEIPTQEEVKTLEDTFGENLTLEPILFAGGFGTPEGYTHIGSTRITDQESDEFIIDVTDVLPNAAKDHNDHHVSLVFDRAPADTTFGRVRVRLIEDGTAHVHVFRKDEDGTTTFTVRTAHGL